MKTVPVDGLWIDMNEPSNFCNGACFKQDQLSEGSGFNLYNPPYNLNNQDKLYPLNVKTLDVYTTQYGGHVFFDTHNLYGEIW
jgi:alpha-glucosidase (family GH31 glycosyl hydrolase)